eukprot:403372007
MLLLDPIYKDSDYYEVVKEKRFYSLLLIIDVIAWFYAGKLMRYEYRKRLSESYPHWIFCLQRLQGNLLKVTDIIFWAFNLVMVIMMFMTKRRTEQNPRPEERPLLEEFERGQTLRNSFSMKRKTNSQNEGSQYIEIKMSRKLIVEQNKVMYEFHVFLLQQENQEYKLQKSYPDFVELESYVIDIINHYSSKKSKVPLLSKMQWNGTKQLLSKQNGQYDQQIMNSDKMFLKRIDDLEKFLKNLIQKYEFWTPEVFEFLKIPVQYQLYLQKEKALAMSKVSQVRKSSYIRPSKVGSQDIENQDSYQSYESQIDVDNYTLIDDYIKPRQSNAQLEKQEEILSKQPFKVTIQDWKRVHSQGEEDYVVYLINIDYTEGQGKTWQIQKRFSDFKELDQYLQKAQVSSSNEIPSLPPRIMKQDNAQVEQRKLLLQTYMRKIMQLEEMPYIIMDFIEFNDYSSMNVRSSVIETLKDVKQATVSIDTSEVIIIDEKPKTIYTLKVKYQDQNQQKSFTIKKRFKDFQNFHVFIQGTFSNDQDYFQLLPQLPQKFQKDGNLQTEQELQKRLEAYLNQILIQPEFNNLICIKTFLSPNYSQQADYQQSQDNQIRTDSMSSPLPSPMQNRSVIGLINNSIIGDEQGDYPFQTHSTFKVSSLYDLYVSQGIQRLETQEKMSDSDEEESPFRF